MKVLLTALVSLNLWGLTLDHSLICSQAKRISYKGIDCCSSRLGQSSCESAVDDLVPESILQLANYIKEETIQESFVPPEIPNCHFSAVEFNFPGMLPLEKLDDDRYEMILANQYVEINGDQLQFGDLVLFYLTAKERIYNPSTFKVTLKPVEGMAHSATYLQDGLIFQKESNLTHSYSIDTIEGTRRAYQAFMNSSKLVNVRMTPVFYRAIVK